MICSRSLAHRRSFFSIVSEGIKAEKVDKEVSSMPLSVDNSNMKPNWNPLSTIREAKNNKRRGKDTSQESQEDSSPKKARHLGTPLAPQIARQILTW
jgi:chromatin remodeling complex protein RSC6